MEKHQYTLEVIGDLLEHFEAIADGLKRAIETKTEDNTLTPRESYLILTILNEFIKDQDKVMSRVIAKELMFSANADHRKDPIS